MKIFVAVLIIIAVVFTAVILVLCIKKKVTDFYYENQNKWLAEEFSRCNVIVFGKKGSGKDLLFAHTIFLRGETHYSNIRYNDNTQIISLLDVSCGGNTFKDFINDTIETLEPIFEEEKDIYISDGGVYFPCQYNELLNKSYGSMPLYYALSRHLYNSNIHVNVQALTRLWDKLREQADSFIRVIDKQLFNEYIIVTAIIYDTYERACSERPPSAEELKNTIYGKVALRKFKIYLSELEYDTRYFKNVFFESKKNPLERIQENVKRKKF